MRQGYCNSEFKFLKKKLSIRYGEFLGSKLFIAAEEKLVEMISKAEFKNSKAIKKHMVKNMLPIIALYLTLKQFTGNNDEPIEFTKNILQVACLKAQKRNRILGRIPFGYSIFRLFCKSIITSQYPHEGWKTEWVRYDEMEIHFNFTSCIYVDTTKQYNCFELCALFCANDDITLAGYAPNILFLRSETIGRGHSHCDFHFVNEKYRNH